MANKTLLKYIKVKIANDRVKPSYNNDNKLVGFYLAKIRSTWARKFFMEDAWEYACKHFDI